MNVKTRKPGLEIRKSTFIHKHAQTERIFFFFQNVHFQNENDNQSTRLFRHDSLSPKITQPIKKWTCVIRKIRFIKCVYKMGTCLIQSNTQNICSLLLWMGVFVLFEMKKTRNFSVNVPLCREYKANQMATNNKTKPTEEEREEKKKSWKWQFVCVWENGPNFLLYNVSYNMCFTLECCFEFL